MKTQYKILALVGAALVGYGVTSAILLAAEPTHRAYPTPVSLDRPKDLSEAARALLDERMNRHGADMVQVFWSVLKLNHLQTETLAAAIADEPGIARPLPGVSNQLNNAFPPAFFDYQDQLRQRAGALEKAAKDKDDRAVARAYGQLTETCVQCHSLYLHGPKENIR